MEEYDNEKRKLKKRVKELREEVEKTSWRTKNGEGDKN